MDQAKIGKFISTCRKEQGLTQAALAEQLGITDRAVSKWENGTSMPDSGIMLELCQALGINVNELLSGERIMTEAYNQAAEKNLLAMKREIEEKNKQLLRIEHLTGIPSVIAALVMCFVAAYIDMPDWTQTSLMIVAALILLAAALMGVRIEQKAGYYECPCCNNRSVPTYIQTILAPHAGRTRYMKCPACGKRGWQKKSISKEAER